MYRIWFLLSAALLWAVLGCQHPTSGTVPSAGPGPAVSAPAEG